MKLVVNEYTVGFNDTMALIVTWFFFVIDTCHLDFYSMVVQFLLFAFSLQNVVLKSEIYHLEQKLEQKKTLSDYVQDD